MALKLTDTAIRNLKSEQKLYKRSDSGGLQLHVMPGGSKLWHLAYRFVGKQKTLALGPYPVVTLAMAREARDEARRLLSQGIDHSEKRKANKRATAAARTFAEVADEWFDTKREPEEKSEATLKRDRWLKGEWKFEIGHRPIGEIEPPELLGALRSGESRARERHGRRRRHPHQCQRSSSLCRLSTVLGRSAASPSRYPRYLVPAPSAYQGPQYECKRRAWDGCG
jgi:hypothetical protein